MNGAFEVIGDLVEQAFEGPPVLGSELADRLGGRVIERGQHAPGLPFALVADPDGYPIEISGPGPAAFTPPMAQ